MAGGGGVYTYAIVTKCVRIKFDVEHENGGLWSEHWTTRSPVFHR
jgi:hypothetical protein